MQHIVLAVGEGHVVEFDFRRVGGLGNRAPALVGQFGLGEDRLDAVHAAVHHREPRHLAVKGLEGREELVHEQQHAQEVLQRHLPVCEEPAKGDPSISTEPRP